MSRARSNRLRYAGVLPYSYDRKGKLVFLLGKEKNGTWSDWGGAVEYGESGLNAAAREAYEESMGMLGSRSHIRQSISYLHRISLPSSARAAMYLMHIPLDPLLETRFDAVWNYVKACDERSSCPKGWLEKSAAAWIRADRLFSLRLSLHAQLPLRSSFRNSLEWIEASVRRYRLM